MIMADDTISNLEKMVLEISPHDIPDLSADILRTDLGGDDAPEVIEAATEPELISAETWAQQWGLMHDMAGGMVQMRTGAPCPLGSLARNEGGMIACQAAYDLILISPAANMILGAHSTFLGQVLAVGMHGFACVQAVKASRAEGAQIHFQSAREAA